MIETCVETYIKNKLQKLRILNFRKFNLSHVVKDMFQSRKFGLQPPSCGAEFHQNLKKCEKRLMFFGVNHAMPKHL